MKTLMPSIAPSVIRSIAPSVITTALCVLLAACGAGDKDPANSELVYTTYKSTLARDVSPDIDATQFEQLVQNNNAFALDLLHQLRAGTEEDIVASPLSVSTTLAMTYAGAGSATKQQMAQALRFNQNDAVLHAGFNRLMAETDGLNLPATDEAEALKIQIVNAVWPALSAEPAQEYLDTLAVNYGEGVYALDYRNEPEPSRKAINDTVAQWTDGLITDLLPQDTITNLTEVVLTNTIYLKAPWKTPFAKQYTQPANFTNLDGSVSAPATMTTQATAYYATNDNAEILILPFRGNELEMAFVIPSAGNFSAYLDQLVNMETLAAQLDAAQQITASVQLPKFKNEFEASLVEPMQNLGMIDAFGDMADFVAMGLSKDLRITAIQHKAIIEVDEGGVIAAAATAAAGGTTSVPTPVSVNRPFIHLIRDRTTGAILFFGTITHLE